MGVSVAILMRPTPRRAWLISHPCRLVDLPLELESFEAFADSLDLVFSALQLLDLLLVFDVDLRDQPAWRSEPGRVHACCRGLSFRKEFVLLLELRSALRLQRSAFRLSRRRENRPILASVSRKFTVLHQGLVIASHKACLLQILEHD